MTITPLPQGAKYRVHGATGPTKNVLPTESSESYTVPGGGSVVIRSDATGVSIESSPDVDVQVRQTAAGTYEITCGRK